MNRKGGRKSGRFSAAEDAVILKYLDKHPLNLSMGFEMAAKALNREERSVTLRYYNSLRNNSQALTIVNNSETQVSRNVKVAKRSKEEPMSLEIAKMSVRRLSKEDRLKLVELLLDES